MTGNESNPSDLNLGWSALQLHGYKSCFRSSSFSAFVESSSSEREPRESFESSERESFVFGSKVLN